jgi:exopolysaccharide biosynthesis polyprenyl glycosylphosphotransferase
MGLCNAIWGVLWRRVYFHGVEKKKSSIVLVGKLAACLRLAKEFDHPPFESRVIVDAIFTSDENFVSDAATSEKPVFALTSFQAYAKENPFTSVIVIPADLGYDSTFSEVLSAAKKGVTVYAMPSAYEILMGRMRHIQVNDLPLLELKLEPPSAFFSFLKRVFDVVFALVLFVLLSPLLLAVAFIVKITSKGPVIYAQERVGFRGKIFRVLKFRSMVSDAEKMSGPVFATKSDSRVTPFGRFMRKTRIDELPQLLNILEGDMSFVGPRPERPVFVNRFEKEIPGYRERKRIRPGVTGLAQVSGNYESSAEVKIKYDLAYMANQSLTLDFQILLRTAKAVFMRAGQ